MELPRSSSDSAIATTCPACLGNGGFGPLRTVSDKSGNTGFNPCSSCAGSGWKLTRIQDVSPIQAERLREKLRPIPPDPDMDFDRQETMDHITRALTGCTIESVTFPGIEPRSIDLTIARRNLTLRILPEFRFNKFHNLNVIPQPTPTTQIDPA